MRTAMALLVVSGSVCVVAMAACTWDCPYDPLCQNHGECVIIDPPPLYPPFDNCVGNVTEREPFQTWRCDPNDSGPKTVCNTGGTSYKCATKYDCDWDCLRCVPILPTGQPVQGYPVECR